jgi:hypothetical protein
VIFGAAAFVVYGATVGQSFDDAAERAIEIDEHRGGYLLSGILQALAVLPLPVVFTYLYRVISFRRPETPRAALYLGVVGPILLAVIAVVGAINELGVADRVVEGLPLPPDDAVDFAKDERAEGPALAFSAIGAASSLATGAALIFVAIHGRRAGIMSAFMSILGVISALFFVLVPPPPIVPWFWFAALGALFLGRWPTGRGPAWESGEAEPWPSAAQARAEQAGGEAPARGGLFGGRARVDEEPDEDYEDDEEYEDAEPGPTPHPRSKKRKRKRRR